MDPIEPNPAPETPAQPAAPTAPAAQPAQGPEQLATPPADPATPPTAAQPEAHPVDLEHPDVKAAIAAAEIRSREQTIEAEKLRVAEEQRTAALTEEQRLREKATADESARKSAEERAAKLELERDMVSSLAARGRVISPGDRRMAIASTVVSEMIAADPKLTVPQAVDKAIAENGWLADMIGGGQAPARPSTVAPQAPAPTVVPQPPKAKDAMEMTKAEFNQHLQKIGARVH